METLCIPPDKFPRAGLTVLGNFEVLFFAFSISPIFDLGMANDRCEDSSEEFFFLGLPIGVLGPI